MMNLKHGHLVEHLANKDKNSNQIDTNVIDVYFEQEYWKMIKDKINVIMNNFFDTPSPKNSVVLPIENTG